MRDVLRQLHDGYRLSSQPRELDELEAGPSPERQLRRSCSTAES
jgi:hypothetical protein